MTPIHRYTPLQSSQSISVTVALCVAHQTLAFITALWLSAGHRSENVFRQNSDACSTSPSRSFSSAKCCSDKNTNLYSLPPAPPLSRRLRKLLEDLLCRGVCLIYIYCWKTLRLRCMTEAKPSTPSTSPARTAKKLFTINGWKEIRKRMLSSSGNKKQTHRQKKQKIFKKFF